MSTSTSLSTWNNPPEQFKRLATELTLKGLINEKDLVAVPMNATDDPNKPETLYLLNIRNTKGSARSKFAFCALKNTYAVPLHSIKKVSMVFTLSHVCFSKPKTKCSDRAIAWVKDLARIFILPFAWLVLIATALFAAIYPSAGLRNAVATLESALLENENYDILRARPKEYFIDKTQPGPSKTTVPLSKEAQLVDQETAKPLAKELLPESSTSNSTLTLSVETPALAKPLDNSTDTSNSISFENSATKAAFTIKPHAKTLALSQAQKSTDPVVTNTSGSTTTTLSSLTTEEIQNDSSNWDEESDTPESVPFPNSLFDKTFKISFGIETAPIPPASTSASSSEPVATTSTTHYDWAETFLDGQNSRTVRGTIFALANSFLSKINFLKQSQTQPLPANQTLSMTSISSSSSSTEVSTTVQLSEPTNTNILSTLNPLVPTSASNASATTQPVEKTSVLNQKKREASRVKRAVNKAAYKAAKKAEHEAAKKEAARVGNFLEKVFGPRMSGLFES